MNIPVIYEDDWLLVVNKPSGLLTIPTPKNELRTLTSILNEDLRKKGLTFRLHPSHRLDKETSGLIIYAKGKSVQKKMMELFKNKNIKKTYIAFIQGILPKTQGIIRNSIDGLKAETKYKVIQQRKNFTLLEAMPLTGRTNQIRIHFKLIGHPIVGETRYAFRRDFKLKAKRLCLHAKDLEFIHPITQKYIRLHASLPLYLKEFLERNK
jgi:23S rRNA pseudouridine1911/1915/1917 synthase